MLLHSPKFMNYVMIIYVSPLFFPTNADGPYGLQVNSDKGLKVGEVFTVDIEGAILFDCSADSYPPNTYSWIQRTDNTTYVIKHGPRLEVAPEKVAQKTTDYVCCAYNNKTGRQDETRFTVIITSVGKCDIKGKDPCETQMHAGLTLPLFYAYVEGNIIVGLLTHSKKLFPELTKPWLLSVKERKPKTEWKRNSISKSQALRKREFNKLCTSKYAFLLS